MSAEDFWKPFEIEIADFNGLLSVINQVMEKAVAKKGKGAGLAPCIRSELKPKQKRIFVEGWINFLVIGIQRFTRISQDFLTLQHRRLKVTSGRDALNKVLLSDNFSAALKISPCYGRYAVRDSR